MKSATKKNPRLVEEQIRSRADYGMAVFGMAFVRNGSGQFLNVRSHGDRLVQQKKKGVKEAA